MTVASIDDKRGRFVQVFHDGVPEGPPAVDPVAMPAGRRRDAAGGGAARDPRRSAMNPDALAALHARAFTDAPRPWTPAEFAAFLVEPSTILVTRSAGFAVGRVAGAEAELLTLAVDPAARRQGVGRCLVAAFEAEAAARGATDALLEVAVTNAAARSLYAALGYSEVGRRRAYYVRPEAPPVDALVLAKPLAATENR
jgi:ribosomal-protein-alanine N-acetyltransferase